MNVLRGGLVVLGTGTLAALQYLLPPGWRYALLSIEFAAIAVVVVNLYGQVKSLTRRGEEHQARLDAIAEVAEHGMVIYEANEVVDVAILALGDVRELESRQ